MLLVGRNDDASLTTLVESLMADLRTPYLIDGNAIFVTVSLGVASTSPGDTRDVVLLGPMPPRTRRSPRDGTAFASPRQTWSLPPASGWPLRRGCARPSTTAPST
jgi:hypothetical protein